MGKALGAPDDALSCLYGGKSASFEMPLMSVSRIFPFPEAPVLL